jgi:hypothetical protein
VGAEPVAVVPECVESRGVDFVALIAAEREFEKRRG